MSSPNPFSHVFNRMLVCFAMAAFGSVMAGCQKQEKAAGKTPNNGDIKIGFLVKLPEDPWFQLEWKFAEEAAKDLGFGLVKIGANDGEKVLSAIDSLAASGVQGFVICTPDTRLGPGIVAKARANGLKLLSVDDQFVGSNGQPMANVHHLGISSEKIGRSVGSALWDEMKHRGWSAETTAVCAVTFDELATTRERTEGAIAELVAKGFPAAQILRAPQRTTDIPAAFDAVNILLSRKSSIDHWLICGVNDNAVLGAVRAMEAFAIGPDRAVGIGINGTDCIAELEKSTPTAFFGSILLSAKDHGYKTSEMMYHWIKDGAEPPLDTRTTGVLITRENFRDVLKAQGVRE
ncbi:MAG: arabinose ABC transporter substrate-binding protein [Opitutus sp.]